MYSEESYIWMCRAAETEPSFPVNHRDWNPAGYLTRRLRFNDRLPIWEICGYLYHHHYVMGQGIHCSACQYDYAGHRSGIERGRAALTHRLTGASE